MKHRTRSFFHGASSAALLGKRPQPSMIGTWGMIRKKRIIVVLAVVGVVSRGGEVVEVETMKSKSRKRFRQ